jgi:hypothetical protein
MKKAFLITAALVLSAGFISGQPSPYKAGEKVSYIVHYGPINGGIASLELKKDTFAGKEVVRSYFIAQTTGVADALYKIKDIYESYMDPVTELPVKSVRNIQEGHYRKYNVVLFDHNSISHRREFMILFHVSIFSGNNSWPGIITLKRVRSFQS